MRPLPSASSTAEGFGDNRDLEGTHDGSQRKKIYPIPETQSDPPTVAAQDYPLDDLRSTQKSSSSDSLGFEVDGQSSDEEGVPEYKEAKKRSADAQIKRRSMKRPPWEKIIEGSVGVMFINRNFSFYEPVYPDDADKHSSYHSGVVAALAFEGAVFPFALVLRGGLANLGLVGRYFRVFGLKSRSSTSIEPLNTTLHGFELGLQYRWNMLNRLSSPTLKVGFELGRLGFFIWDTETNRVDLPDITYLYLKLALVGLEVPFFSSRSLIIGAYGSFDFLIIFSAGDIERTDSAGYGKSTTNGINGGAGLFGSYKGFFLRMEGFYRRIFYDFDNACYQQTLGCKAAGGALDIYVGGMIKLGYAF